MRKVTVIILAAVGGLLLAWDIYAYLAAGTQATISVVIRDAATDWLIVPDRFRLYCR